MQGQILLFAVLWKFVGFNGHSHRCSPGNSLSFRLFRVQEWIWLLVLKVVCREITGMPVIQRGHANARRRSQRESELCTGWQHLLLVVGIFLLTEPGLEAYIPSRLLACLAAGMGDGGGWNGGRWESVLVAVFAENSKPFRPFLVMVENVRIDCIRDLPVSLTHLLRCSSSLPSSLVSRAGCSSANAALLLQHGYYVPHTATTEILP